MAFPADVRNFDFDAVRRSTWNFLPRSVGVSDGGCSGVGSCGLINCYIPFIRRGYCRWSHWRHASGKSKDIAA